MAEPKAVCHPKRKLIAGGKCLECLRSWWDSKKPSERYGATTDECMDMLEAQGYVCPVCELPFLKDTPVIDHKHWPKRPRGVLHSTCNSGLGLMMDSPEVLERAARYLREPTYEVVVAKAGTESEAA